MANTQAMCTSFKAELLNGHHIFNGATWSSAHGGVTGTTVTADAFKGALYLATATVDATTTAYSATGEATCTGTGYTAGGTALTWSAAGTAAGTAASGTAYINPAASLTWTISGGTLGPTNFDSVLVYNSTQGNKAVSVHTFTGQTITNGTLTLTMPGNAAGTALLRFA